MSLQAVVPFALAVMLPKSLPRTAVTGQGPLALGGVSGFYLQTSWVQCQDCNHSHQQRKSQTPGKSGNARKPQLRSLYHSALRDRPLNYSPNTDEGLWGGWRGSASSAVSFLSASAAQPSCCRQGHGVWVAASHSNDLKQERYAGLGRRGSCSRRGKKHYRRFDSSAVGQDKKVQHREPQRNWIFTSFLHLKLLHSKENNEI